MATAAITVPLTLLGLLITVSIFAGYGIKEQAKFQQKTEDRLSTIEANLLTLRAGQNPKKVLGELAAFDVKQLTKNLPALRELSEQPVKQVLPNPSALRNVSETLAKVSDATDDYWPTVLRFIQFASAGMSNNAPPSDLHPNLHRE